MIKLKQATHAQIRARYKDMGYAVRISREGHITFRGHGVMTWLDGRWVTEYVVENVGGTPTVMLR